MSVVADRAFTSRSTLQRVEEGSPTVSVSIYAAVLQALGLLDRLAEVAHVSKDTVGQELMARELPKRVRIRRATVKPLGG